MPESPTQAPPCQEWGNKAHMLALANQRERIAAIEKECGQLRDQLEAQAQASKKPPSMEEVRAAFESEFETPPARLHFGYENPEAQAMWSGYLSAHNRIAMPGVAKQLHIQS